MASYRYCRSDDVALLVQAYNECYRVHFPDSPEMSVERFKRLLREIDLWTSSCMIAREGDELIAVMLATKRDDEALIHSIGVKPDHRRQGHARHLLTSLGQKAAILGPSRLVAEVARAQQAGRALLEACGYREELEYTDFVLRATAPAAEPSPLVIPITLDELLANDAFDMNARRCWNRSPRTLLKRADRVRGLAVASDARIEASLLFAQAPESASLRLLAFESAAGDRGRIWFELLLRHARRDDPRPVTIDRVHAEETVFDLLRSCGFETGSVTIGLAAEPVPL
jgi:ribosomal protein S18 acetylase RimI-like enzyme